MAPGQLVELLEIALSEPDPNMPRLEPPSLSPRARRLHALDRPRELVALRDLPPRREIVRPAAQRIDVLEPLFRRREFLGLPPRIGLEGVPRDRVRIVLGILVAGLPLEGLAGVIAGAISVITGVSTLIAGAITVITHVSIVISRVSIVIAGVSTVIASAITLT